MAPEADAHHRGSVSVVDVEDYCSSSSSGGSVSDSDDDEEHCVSMRGRKRPRVQLPKGFLDPLPPETLRRSERCKAEEAAPDSEPCGGYRPRQPGDYGAPFPIRDEEEADRFSVLSKSKVVVARYFDYPALGGIGVLDQINGWIDRLGWHTFVREREPTHRTLTIEFYTTFRFCDGSRRSFSYRSNGQNREVTYELLGEILGCQANGLTVPPDTFIRDDYWHHLTGRKRLNARNASNGSIRNVALLIFHKFICHAIFGKTKGAEVSALELWLLWCVENNVKVSLIHLLVERMGAISTSSRPTLGLGHVIIKLAKHFGDFLDEGDEDSIIPFQLLGMPALKAPTITPNSSKHTLRRDQRRCDERVERDRSLCAGPAAEPRVETPDSEEPGTSSTAPASLDTVIQRLDRMEERIRSDRRERQRQARMLASICDHHGIPYDPPSPSESSPIHEP